MAIYVWSRNQGDPGKNAIALYGTAIAVVDDTYDGCDASPAEIEGATNRGRPPFPHLATSIRAAPRLTHNGGAIPTTVSSVVDDMAISGYQPDGVSQ